MNEEMQSSNEELAATNDELRRSSAELNQLNLFLETMMNSVGSGVVVVDSGLRVQAWNKHCHELWGLTAEEVKGRALLNLDIGLPLEEVGRVLVQSLAGNPQETLVVDAMNRRGAQIRCRVTVTPMASGAGGGGRGGHPPN